MGQWYTVTGTVEILRVYECCNWTKENTMGASKHCEGTSEVCFSAVAETDLDLFNIVMTQGITVMSTEVQCERKTDRDRTEKNCDRTSEKCNRIKDYEN